LGDQAKPSTFGSTWWAPCPSGPVSQSAPLVTAPSADGEPTRKASRRPSGDQAGEPGVFPAVFPAATACRVAGRPAAAPSST
jgi:hypothetical protein